MRSKITCLGSFVVDLTCRSEHLPIPGETVATDYFKMGPGGKGANQATASKRTGGNITLMTKIGNDLLSNVAIESFNKEGFDPKYIIRDDNNFTGIALITVDKNTSQNSIVVAAGACEHINDNDLELLRPEIESCDIFLTQLELNLDIIEKAIDMAYKNNKIIVLNTAPAKIISDEVLRKVTIVTPNEIEASILTNVEVKDIDSAREAAKVFFKKGVQKVIITLGKNGSYVNDGNKEKFVPSIEVETIDTTGAGDAFTGGLVTALSEKLDLFDAVEFATAVAALSTTKLGTAPSMPYRDEVDKLLKNKSSRN